MRIKTQVCCYGGSLTIAWKQLYFALAHLSFPQICLKAFRKTKWSLCDQRRGKWTILGGLSDSLFLIQLGLSTAEQLWWYQEGPTGAQVSMRYRLQFLIQADSAFFTLVKASSNISRNTIIKVYPRSLTRVIVFPSLTSIFNNKRTNVELLLLLVRCHLAN